MKQYNKNNVSLAKTLRKNMADQERKLWYLFLKNHDFRFQRQKLLGDYIADFYCAKAKLVIELDGGGHYTDEQLSKDKKRTTDLNSMDLTVLRFTNTDVDKNFKNICENINFVIKSSLPQSKS